MSDTIAEVRSWNDLHAAFRARAESLNVSRLVLDELSGLQSGYASKLLAPVPMRHFGRVSLGAMLGALGLKLVVQEDKEALARVAGRLVGRERNVRRRSRCPSITKCPLMTQSGHYAVKHSWLCSAVDVRFLMQNDIQQ
jgi:hypothetical protein